MCGLVNRSSFLSVISFSSSLDKLLLDIKITHLCSGWLEVNPVVYVLHAAFKVTVSKNERKKQTFPWNNIFLTIDILQVII